MGDFQGQFGADLQLFFSALQRRKIWERYNRRGDSVDTVDSEPKGVRQRGVKPLLYNTLSFFKEKEDK